MKYSQAILNVLDKQTFADWYNGDFEDFITGEMEHRDKITFTEAKLRILRDIERMFKLEQISAQMSNPGGNIGPISYVCQNTAFPPLPDSIEGKLAQVESIENPCPTCGVNWHV